MRAAKLEHSPIPDTDGTGSILRWVKAYCTYSYCLKTLCWDSNLIYSGVGVGRPSMQFTTWVLELLCVGGYLEMWCGISISSNTSFLRGAIRRGGRR